MLVSNKYSNGRSSTLFEHMEGKDTDLIELEHDDICLKLVNEKILKKIFLEKVFKEELKNDSYTPKCEIMKLSSSYDKCFFRVKGNDYLSYTCNHKLEETLKKQTIYRKSELDIVDSKIGHVVVKRGSNGFSQRLGFVDVFVRLSVVKTWKIKYEDKFYQLDYTEKEYVMFFKIKTSKPSINVICRDIEFFRDALKEIEKTGVTPFYVGHSKIPVKQFESITFDEILEMEREIKNA